MSQVCSIWVFLLVQLTSVLLHGSSSSEKLPVIADISSARNASVQEHFQGTAQSREGNPVFTRFLVAEQFFGYIQYRPNSFWLSMRVSSGCDEPGFV